MENNTVTPRETRAMNLLLEMREMLNDIAQSATILGATPFAAREAANALGTNLHTALLEFEIALAQVHNHNFHVPR